MRIRLTSTLIAVCLAAVASPVFAQGRGQVSAYVRGPDNEPIQGAVVIFQNINNQGQKLEYKTDKNGRAFAISHPAGRWAVTVQVDGQTRAYRDYVQTFTGTQPRETEQLLNFNLKPANADGTFDVDAVGASATAEQKAAMDAAAEEAAKTSALKEAFDAATAALDAKDWDTAIEQFNTAAENDPAQVAVWRGLADAYVGKADATATGRDENLSKAFEMLDKAIALKPASADIYNQYAVALVKANRMDDATTYLNKAIELDPANAATAHFNMGVLLSNAGKTTEAAAAFKKAIEVNPDYAEANYQYGLAMVGPAMAEPGSPMVADTIAAFQKYLELAPNGPNAPVAQQMIDALQAMK